MPRDAGWVRPEDLHRDLEMHGRGGTALQPAVDLIVALRDFPADGPILILTDGAIEASLRVPLEHAYVLPRGSQLPFAPRGPVFNFAE